MGEARSGERILIVEPESDIALLLETLLRDEGYTTLAVRTMPNPQDSLESRVDLVILDMCLNLNAGLTTIDDLLPFVAVGHTPVLCLSTDARSMAALEGTPHVAGTLGMPFEVESLLSKVRAALRRPGGCEAGPRAA